MKTRNLIFAILWVLLAIMMAVCAIVQWTRAEYWAVLIAAMAFSCDSYNAWNHLGYWLDARKALKRTKEEILVDYDKTMAEWEYNFQDVYEK